MKTIEMLILIIDYHSMEENLQRLVLFVAYIKTR